MSPYSTTHNAYARLENKLAREAREAQRLLDAAQNEDDPARAARLVREAKRLGR